MILKIVYGHDTMPGKDPLVEVVDEAMSQFIHMSRPGAYLVDFLPILRFIPSWFPGGGFKKEAKYNRKTLLDMINMPFSLVQDQMVCILVSSRNPFLMVDVPQKKGIAPPSYVSNLLSADDYTPDQEYAVKTSAATVYAGGADTVCPLLLCPLGPSPNAARTDQRAGPRILSPHAAVAGAAEEGSSRNRPCCRKRSLAGLQ